MQQRKIITLLKICSEEELKDFGNFIRSPFFNENKRLIDLFDYLKNFAPHFEAPGLSEEKAYKSVFGSEPYQEKRLARLLSKMCKLFDQFIEHASLKANPEVGFSYKMAFFEKKNQAVFLEQQLKYFRQWLDQNAPKHHRYEHARFNLEKSHSNFIHRQQQYSKGGVNLQEAMNALDHYYLVEKLMLATEMYNRQAVLPVSYSPLFLEDILQELNRNLDQFSPTVQIWYHAFCLIREPDSKETYFQLKSELLRKLDDLNEEDGLALFLFLQNSLHKAISPNSPDYSGELFDLYQVQIDKSWIFSTNGTLRITLFQNVVQVGLNLKKLNWVENFIQKYGHQLEENLKEEMLNYASALLAFEKGDYGDALRQSSLISQKELVFAFGVKRLLVKIYYERKDEEAFLSAINTYRVYLHRLTRISTRHKEANIAFLNSVSALGRIRSETSEKQKTNALHEEIGQTPLLPERNWLLEKLELIQSQERD